MIKYCGAHVTFQEVPNEISLTISITNCPHQCPGCHSPWLQTDIGDELTPSELRRLIRLYQDGITCVCFMGEGNDPEALAALITQAHAMGLKTCLYSGSASMADHPINKFLGVDATLDYFKVGPYVQERGGLNSPTTNQRMYRKVAPPNLYQNITSWFWKEKT